MNSTAEWEDTQKTKIQQMFDFVLVCGSGASLVKVVKDQENRKIWNDLIPILRRELTAVCCAWNRNSSKCYKINAHLPYLDIVDAMSNEWRRRRVDIKTYRGEAKKNWRLKSIYDIARSLQSHVKLCFVCFSLFLLFHYNSLVGRASTHLAIKGNFVLFFEQIFSQISTALPDGEEFSWNSIWFHD